MVPPVTELGGTAPPPLQQGLWRGEGFQPPFDPQSNLLSPVHYKRFLPNFDGLYM